MENRDPLTERIIGCCFEVHKELGSSFFKFVCFAYMRSQILCGQEHLVAVKSIQFNRQKRVDISWSVL